MRSLDLCPPGSTNSQSLSPSGACVGIVDDPVFEAHCPPIPHSERPARVVAARKGARTTTHLVPIPARPALRPELERVHDAAYLDRLEELDGKEDWLDEDTYICSQSVQAARMAAGGSMALVDALAGSVVKAGFVLARPPGHHATHSRGMGFCVLNNVAVAAAHAKRCGLERVAIVDWDVHHGNGTQDIFWEDPQVLFVSIHQYPLFPGTGVVDEVGAGPGEGFTLNIPLSEGAAGAEYLEAFDRIVVPAVNAFAPDIVLVSAGFDAHRGDPLAQMQLDASVFAKMTARLRLAAETSARGRIGLVLEGGYDLGALERSVSACMRTLELPPAALSQLATSSSPRPRAGYLEEIDRAARSARAYWSDCL